MKQLKLLTLSVILLQLNACSSFPTLKDIAKLSPWYRYNDVEQITLFVHPDPELRYALSIDVVFIYQDLVQTVLSDLTAVDWFSQKTGLLANYGHQIDVLEWQIVPGFAEQSLALPKRHSDAKAVIAFAYYPPNPDTKAVLTELATPWLIFKGGKLSTLAKPPLSLGKGDKS